MESSNGMSQSQDNYQPVESEPVSQSINPIVKQPEERLFKQSDVNEIVKKAKHEAVEGYKKISVEQPQYAQQKYGDSVALNNNVPRGNLPEDDIKRIAAEEVTRLRDQWNQDARERSDHEKAKHVVQNFVNKMSTGKDKYKDFDQVVGDIDYSKFPNVVELLTEHVDNFADVLYEMGNDRIKMANLQQLALMSPRDAIIQVKKLSNSIKDNENASKYKIPNEPLSQVRPSNAGTDNGALTVKDYRAKYRV